MTPKAKIYRPAKTAMQSGKRKTKHWLFEYSPDVANTPDPLMGWNSGGTLQQIKLEFDTKEHAIAYAKKKHVDYVVIEPHERETIPKSYDANFQNNRVMPF